MRWQIAFSSDSVKFLKRSRIAEGLAVEKIVLVLRKFAGENVSIDVVKLSGRWNGFHRIRVGKWRILAEFNFENQRVHIERIDWRGGAYR